MTAFLSALLVARAIVLSAPPFCPGDCDENGRTADVELRTAVELVFDAPSLPTCQAADVDGTGQVTAADLVAILTASATVPAGCHAPPTDASSPTATATPSPSPTATVDATPVSTWVMLAPLAEGARQEVGVAAVGSSIYVLGGFDGRGRGSALVERYDIGENRWTTVKPLPRALQHVGSAALDGHVYCVGGFIGSSFVPTDEMFRYDPTSDEWTELKELPRARGALAAVAVNGRIHALGGSSSQGSVGDHTAYDPIANEWTELAAAPGAGRNHLAAAVLGDRIYLVGGRRDGGATDNSAALDRYDPIANEWESLPDMPTARSGHAVAVLAGRLVALGGEVNLPHPLGVFPQVEIYDPQANAWTSLDDMPVPRHGIGASVVGARLYVPGGATVAGFGATAHHDALEIGP